MAQQGVFFVLGGLLACTGCRSARHVQVDGETPVARDGAVMAAKLRPGLLVNVQVLVTGQKEIDEKNRRISESGLITLPLVGDVPVGGLTIGAAQSLLRAFYKRYYVEPQVLIECQMEEGGDAVSPWGFVTVLGRVKKPGQVNVPPTRDLTVSRAIQLAGGLDTSARSDAIRVTRTRGNRKEQFKVDLERIGLRGTPKDDIQLMQGDVVYVPEAAL